MQEYIAFILVSVLGVALVAGVIYFIYRRDHPKKHKTRGRANRSAAAVGALRGFAQSNSFKFMAPAHLTRNVGTAQLDAIAVGYFGVIGVIALGYNGEIYGEAGEENWLQVGEDGQRNYFANPITEAAAAVRVVRDALFAEKLKNIPVEVVCVFTDPKAQLALPRSTGHHTMQTFKALLRQDKYLNDTGLDMDKVLAALQKAAQPQ